MLDCNVFSAIPLPKLADWNSAGLRCCPVPSLSTQFLKIEAATDTFCNDGRRIIIGYCFRMWLEEIRVARCSSMSRQLTTSGGRVRQKCSRLGTLHGAPSMGCEDRWPLGESGLLRYVTRCAAAMSLADGSEKRRASAPVSQAPEQMLTFGRVSQAVSPGYLGEELSRQLTPLRRSPFRLTRRGSP